MATFNTVAAFNSLLQRKALVGAVLVADYATAALTSITTGSGNANALDAFTGYSSLGKLSNDGLEFANDMEKQEDRGWGDSSPSRIDVVTETSAFNFTAWETNLETIDAFYGVDQTNVQGDLTTGELTFDKPPVPVLRDKRTLALFRDINKSNGLDVYMGIHFPRSNLSQNGSQSFSNAEGGWVYPLTSQALVDETEGTAVRLFMGGPGLAGMLTDMGYTQATA